MTASRSGNPPATGTRRCRRSPTSSTSPPHWRFRMRRLSSFGTASAPTNRGPCSPNPDHSGRGMIPNRGLRMGLKPSGLVAQQPPHGTRTLVARSQCVHGVDRSFTPADRHHEARQRRTAGEARRCPGEWHSLARRRCIQARRMEQRRVLGSCTSPQPAPVSSY